MAFGIHDTPVFQNPHISNIDPLRHLGVSQQPPPPPPPNTFLEEAEEFPWVPSGFTDFRKPRGARLSGVHLSLGQGMWFSMPRWIVIRHLALPYISAIMGITMCSCFIGGAIQCARTVALEEFTRTFRLLTLLQTNMEPIGPPR